LGRQADLKVGLYLSPRALRVRETPLPCSAANGANRMAGNSSSIASIRRLSTWPRRLGILSPWPRLELLDLPDLKDPASTSTDGCFSLTLKPPGRGRRRGYAFLVGCAGSSRLRRVGFGGPGAVLRSASSSSPTRPSVRCSESVAELPRIARVVT
jgi:hypothetical protein